jgi:hypothetical protein
VGAKIANDSPERRIAKKDGAQRTVVAATTAAGACRSLVIHVEGRVAETGSRKYHVDDAHGVACGLTFRVLKWGIWGRNVLQRDVSNYRVRKSNIRVN